MRTEHAVCKVRVVAEEFCRTKVGYLLAELICLSGDERTKGSKKEKPSTDKPESFDGELDSSPTYRRWHKQMDSCLGYHRGAWEDDANLLIIVGSCMKGAAWEWFDNRAEGLQNNRKVDNFVDFVSAMGERFKPDNEDDIFVPAMDERFKTYNEDDISFDKLHEVQNKGGILKYIDSLQRLNQKVRLRGLVHR